MALIVRQPAADDEEAWRSMFSAYQAFYRAAIPDDVVTETWRRIHNPSSDVNAFVAELDGEIVGITHYLFPASTWNDRPSCYLEDLYVSKTSRGGGVARKLIESVEDAAKKRNAFRLYLHTQQFNSSARSLYDSMMLPSSFVVYRKAL